MSYDWDWSVFLQSADGVHSYLSLVGQGFITTLEISIGAWIIAFLLGSVLGVMRTTTSPVLRAIGATYVDILRNTPLIVQLFIWFYLAPNFLPESWRNWMFALPPEQSALITGIIGLGIYTASRVCEQVRAGIQSMPRGLMDAGLAVGMSPMQVYYEVLLPVVYRMLIPPLTSEVTSLVKNSSIASTIGVLDLFARVNQLNDYTNHPYESFLLVTGCYLLINAIIILIMNLLEKRFALAGNMGS